MKIGIIGPGKVGSAILALAAEAGYEIAYVAGRNRDRARRAADLVGSEIPAFSLASVPPTASLIFLTVTDDAIAEVSGLIDRSGGLSSARTLVHCSGVLSSEVLRRSIGANHCQVVSAHPLQTFPDLPTALKGLPGSFWFCEGDTRGLEDIIGVIEQVGGRPQLIPTAFKPLYHAAAVIACNYLVTLVDAALEAASSAGVGRAIALEALHPLMAQTVDNVVRLDTAAALTGPIARGDVATVNAHTELIRSRTPEILDLYLILARRTVALANRKGTLDKTKADQIVQILDETDQS